jgi:redox-sensitive bicupin YhaK (pirin superfamily)
MVMQILRAHQSPTHGNGGFRVRRVRPGVIAGPSADPAFGPLSVIDHAHVSVGMVVKMHEHKNDEILSYVLRGTTLHEDSSGHRVTVSANKLMMMNAGKSFWHEESAHDEPVEGLQIFVRPCEADLPAAVSFFDRADGPSEGTWSLVAGPEDGDAPLKFRNAVWLYDIRLHEGQEISVPIAAGLSPWLYIMDGVVEVGGERLGKGDAVSDSD